MIEGSVPAQIRSALTHLENFLIQRIDLLITVGEKLRQHFASRGARHSVVIGNWKRIEDFSRTEQQNQEARRRLGVPDSAVLVVCITQLLKDRQIEELLQAAVDCPNVYVLIGGKGALQPVVEHAAGINPRIRFVGYISGKAIADYTCAGDVVYYGFDPENPNARFSAPNKLYEALAAGRPLITGDFGEIGDVVRKAECGIVLREYSMESVREALVEMQDAERRRILATHAADYGRASMNWNRGVETLCHEYGALIPTVLGPQFCAS
jgi:glycosyltransferase involved in cell wall biosynthesis